MRSKEIWHIGVWITWCLLCTGKSLSEALIFASTNPQYDNWLFIELQVQYMNIPNSNLGRTCCVHNCFWHSEQFLYITCSPHVLQKEELLTKIYLYYVQSTKKINFLIGRGTTEIQWSQVSTPQRWSSRRNNGIRSSLWSSRQNCLRSNRGKV